MNRTKRKVLGAAGLVIGLVTLRSLRKRRSEKRSDDESDVKPNDEQEDEKAIEESAEESIDGGGGPKEEAITAAKHAAVAVKHAGKAAQGAIKVRREKRTDTSETADAEK